ncbi:MAG: GDSL-type esterase/lipase family protein [Actinomycetota bacterium]
MVAGVQLITGEAASAAVFPGVTQLASTAADGSKITPAVGPDISQDGRYVAFGQSSAVSPVWRKDRLTGDLVLVSQSSGGVAANGQSYSVSLSPDGRYAAFASTATNLVSGDSNGVPDVFLRDIATGVTARVSIRADGTQPNGTSFQPAVSADGRYVAFHSDATNLVSGLTTSGLQVYVKDMVTGSLTLASKSPTTGEPGSGDSSDVSISGDGTLLAFTSSATNLATDPTDPSPGAGDVFLLNRLSGAVTLLSDFQVDPETRVTSGSLAELSIDGTAITFVAAASAALLAYGSPTGSLSVLRNNGSLVIDPFDPAISANGNQIAFSSFTPLTPEAGSFASRQLYSFDRTASSIQLVTIGTDGQPGNRETGHLQGSFAMSGDGRSVTFQTAASNLVAGDDPSSVDVLVRGPNVVVDPGTTTTTAASTSTSSSTSSTSTSSTTTSTSTTSSTTPTTSARVSYVALGDSYSAGEGNPPFIRGSDTDSNMCHRSFAAYPYEIAVTRSLRLVHAACSGAILQDLSKPNFAANSGEGPQLSHLDSSTALVTLSMGGNDLGFGYALAKCAESGNCSIDPELNGLVAKHLIWLITGHAQDCTDGMFLALGVCAPATPSLLDSYKEIARRAPNARIVVLNYPSLFPRNPQSTCRVVSLLPLGPGWTIEEQQWMNAWGQRLNRVIQSQVDLARAAGIDIVLADVWTAFGDRGVCTDDPWIIGLQFDLSRLYYSRLSFHPSRPGQEAMTRAVLRSI